MLRESILKTIAYFDTQDFPLTLEELHIFLWKYECSYEQLIDEVAKISFLEGKEGYVFLPNRHELVAKRKQNEGLIDELWKKTHKYVRYLQMLPFIEMVSVGNNLAMKNPHPESDIDLFIIIQEKHLWTVRYLITGLLHLLGVRRHSNKVAGRFCLSFFITEKALNLENIALESEDIYFVYWLTTLKPVLGEQMYNTFIQENKTFIQEYLPNWEIPHKHHSLIDGFAFGVIHKFLNCILRGRLGQKLEKTLKKRLKKRAENKAEQLDNRAEVIISDSILKFHNIDRRNDFKMRWKNKFEEIQNMK